MYISLAFSFSFSLCLVSLSLSLGYIYCAFEKCVQEQTSVSGNQFNATAGTSNAGDFVGSNTYGMSALHNQVSYMLK